MCQYISDLKYLTWIHQVQTNISQERKGLNQKNSSIQLERISCVC